MTFLSQQTWLLVQTMQLCSCDRKLQFAKLNDSEKFIFCKIRVKLVADGNGTTVLLRWKKVQFAKTNHLKNGFCEETFLTFLSGRTWL